MITELKIGDKIKLEGYDEAWIGWVTTSSYQISKIRSRADENGKIEVCWVTKWDWHSKN
jgi:hypothetical protein